MTLPDESKDTLDLLTRAESGDVSATNLLFERHLPGVKASVRRRLRPQLNPRFDASDVIQETHEVALRKFDDYLHRRPMPFSLWLLRTAHQRLVDLERMHLRAAKRAVDREVPLPDRSSMNLLAALAGRQVEPIQELQLRERAQTVRNCLANLDEIDRQVLMLRVFDGLKNIEVAQVLDISADAAKKRFARALERLRGLLVNAGIKELNG